MFNFFIFNVFIFDKFVFEEKKVPTVTTSNSLHGVLFSPWIPFYGEKFPDTSAPIMGGGGGGGGAT